MSYSIVAIFPSDIISNSFMDTRKNFNGFPRLSKTEKLLSSLPVLISEIVPGTFDGKMNLTTWRGILGVCSLTCKVLLVHCFKSINKLKASPAPNDSLFKHNNKSSVKLLFIAKINCLLFENSYWFLKSNIYVRVFLFL